jgi:hypothetical protein
VSDHRWTLSQRRRRGLQARDRCAGVLIN